MHHDQMIGRPALGWLGAAAPDHNLSDHGPYESSFLLRPCFVQDSDGSWQHAASPDLILPVHFLSPDETLQTCGTPAGAIVFFVINNLPDGFGAPQYVPDSQSHQLSQGSAILSGQHQYSLSDTQLAPLLHSPLQAAPAAAQAAPAAPAALAAPFSTAVFKAALRSGPLSSQADLVIDPLVCNGVLQLPAACIRPSPDLPVPPHGPSNTDHAPESDNIAYISTIRTLKAQIAALQIQLQSGSSNPEDLASAPPAAAAPTADTVSAHTTQDDTARAAAVQAAYSRENEQMRQELAYAKNRIADLEAYNARCYQELEQLRDKAQQACANSTAAAPLNHYHAAAVMEAPEAAAQQRPQLLAGDRVEENELFNDAHTIISRVCRTFARAHVPITRNQAANYLICLTQGMMTVFYGPSGSGKSTRCRLLSRALGLEQARVMPLASGLDPHCSAACSPTSGAGTPAAVRRCLEVAVEPGWTSLKDYAAFYNPLKSSLEPVNSELFEALQELDAQARCPAQHSSASGSVPLRASGSAPFVIALDNADLSSPEYYWSAFARGCDGVPVQLNFGGGRSFIMPDTLRFTASVSQSHSHIPLSPALLERSWIISLTNGSAASTPQPDHSSADQALSHESLISDAQLLSGTVSMEQLQRAFGPDPDFAFEGHSAGKWEDLIALFARSDIDMPLSWRTMQMVRNYCSAAWRVMADDDEKESSLLTLDYAVSQKILPLISGSGRRHEHLMRSLSGEFTEDYMPLSCAILRRMNEGQHSPARFYTFFS